VSISQVVVNGVGTPADIAHNVLFGLEPAAAATPIPTTGGGYPITQPPRDHRALLNRDYRERDLPNRIARIPGYAKASEMRAVAFVRPVRARGGIGYEPARARVAPMMGTASVSAVEGRGSARAKASRMAAESPEELFLLGFLAGSD